MRVASWRAALPNQRALDGPWPRRADDTQRRAGISHHADLNLHPGLGRHQRLRLPSTSPPRSIRCWMRAGPPSAFAGSVAMASTQESTPASASTSTGSQGRTGGRHCPLRRRRADRGAARTTRNAHGKNAPAARSNIVTKPAAERMVGLSKGLRGTMPTRRCGARSMPGVFADRVALRLSGYWMVHDAYDEAAPAATVKHLASQWRTAEGTCPSRR